MLVKAQLITDSQLEEALKVQRRDGGKLGGIVVRLGFCSDQDIVSFLGMQYGVPAADLDQWPAIEAPVIALVPAELATKHKVLPLQRSGNVLTLAMSDPTDIFAMDDVRFHTGYNIDPVVSSEMGLVRAIERYYGGASGLRLRDDAAIARGTSAAPAGTAAQAKGPSFDDLGEAIDLNRLEEELEETETTYESISDDDESVNAAALAQSGEEAPVVRLVNMVLIDAIRRGASDIHIEPYEKSYRIRFRIDGLLQEVMRPNIRLKDPVTSRVKILAKLNIAEKRLPQDGRIKLRVNLSGQQKVIDYRVSVLPTLFGEKIVLRLLDSDKLMLDLTKLGFEPESLQQWDRQISKPYGMVLVTGPTGSGKTNTLYSSIAKLNQVDVNIMTAEDPVEINLPGVNQVQINPKVGLTFASALRSFLRQDPNIILVGEIRDGDTARMAFQAAMTGHQVYSTLHTSSAIGAIPRLLDIGILPDILAGNVIGIVAQRLVRRLCPACREARPAHDYEMRLLGLTLPSERPLLHEARGCPQCDFQGYRGRMAIMELLRMDPELDELVARRATAREIREAASRKGFRPLADDGARRVLEGATTLDELCRVVNLTDRMSP